MPNWKVATLLETKKIADNVKSLIFDCPDFPTHFAGQHLNIRLTSQDGYSAERDYSLANPPEQKNIELGTQLLEDGEVSPYLWQMTPGQKIEIRGPIGGHFVWDITMPGPLILIGGGAGMVPLISILRHHLNNLESEQSLPSGRQVIFLISARNLGYVLYKEELELAQKKDPNLKVIITITDSPPKDWTGYTKRIDQQILEKELAKLKNQMPLTYICGPTPFVEAVANDMVKIGFNSHEIKTERFGG